MKTQLLLCAVSALSVACGAFDEEKKNEPARTRDPNAPLEFYSQDVTKLSYASAPSGSPKIFLVAGSLEAANFGQEVIDQKKFWASRGIAESDIACYYVIPDKIAFDNDKNQYLALAGELSKCQVASAKRVRYDLLQAASTAPDFVYLYVTSHGSYPLSYRIQNEQDANQLNYYNNVLNSYPFLDQYTISLDATDNGTTNMQGLLAAYNSGTNPEDLFFTPGYLQNTLNQFPTNTKKYVVIQGCYSGGFVNEPSQQFQADTLAYVSNITAMTASIYNRPSFGCNEGGERTYFGEAFSTSLSEAAALPTQINWQNLYSKTKSRVEEKEKELMKTQSIKESQPQFLQN